jgi:hypothetical protein
LQLFRHWGITFIFIFSSFDGLFSNNLTFTNLLLQFFNSFWNIINSWWEWSLLTNKCCEQWIQTSSKVKVKKMENITILKHKKFFFVCVLNKVHTVCMIIFQTMNINE